MKPDEILKLIDAGYTKEEIQAMDQPEEPGQEPKADKPQDEPIPEPHDIDQQPARDSQALDEVRQELKTTQQQLADLVKQMQRNNLATASVNILPENDLDKKTDEAMAELIRPKIVERKGD